MSFNRNQVRRGSNSGHFNKHRKTSKDFQRGRNNSQDLSDSRSRGKFNRGHHNRGPADKKKFIKKDHQKRDRKDSN